MKDLNLLAFILSITANITIIILSRKYSLFLDPLANIKIQSFHKNLTPRAGGITIYILSLIFSYFLSANMFLVILSFLPAFIYGVYEDIDGNTPQKVRLLVMAVSTVIATLITNVTIESIGIIDIPKFAQIPFTVFAVIGLASAINFIDGLNGLASGITTVTFAVFGFAAFITGNYELASVMFIISSILLGFFSFNFPFGKIFLGDAGAYFLGYILAMSSESLVFHNLKISPWFPVALLGYPIIETLYTMWRRYRRLQRKGVKFFTAERVHLHSLLYLRVFRNNSLASLSIISIFSLNALIAFQYKESGPICATIFFIECIIYLVLYKNIINFKAGKLVNNISRKLVPINYRQALTDLRYRKELSEYNHPISEASLFKTEEKVLASVNSDSFEEIL